MMPSDYQAIVDRTFPNVEGGLEVDDIREHVNGLWTELRVYGCNVANGSLRFRLMRRPGMKDWFVVFVTWIIEDPLGNQHEIFVTSPYKGE